MSSSFLFSLPAAIPIGQSVLVVVGSNGQFDSMEFRPTRPEKDQIPVKRAVNFEMVIPKVVATEVYEGRFPFFRSPSRRTVASPLLRGCSPKTLFLHGFAG